MQSALLPLFPLEVVLLPRATLTLHIFEDRYKEMIAEVLAARSEFGVVLQQQQGLASAGASATIENVLKKYPDGRLDILVLGRRRFQVVRLNDEKPYLRAQVQFFDDEEAAPPPRQLQSRAIQLCRSLLELEDTGPLPETGFQDPQLSFVLARVVADLDFRQSMLVLRSEAERMSKMVAFLEQYVPRQRLIAAVRRVAPRNGRSRLPMPPSERV